MKKCDRIMLKNNDVYEAGRTEAISNAEIEQQVKKAFTTGIHQFSLVK